MNVTDIVTRLQTVTDAARYKADRAGWHWQGDETHPVFQALTDETVSILAEYGVTPTPRQTRVLARIADDSELETLADIVELIVSGRSK